MPEASKPITFDNSYTALPEHFFARVKPAVPSNPKLLIANSDLARELNIDPSWLTSVSGVEALSGGIILDGSDPISATYAGSQFGNFVPALGDGRAALLGEIIDTNGERRDIQLKGSGLTPFSRNGDGKAALGPVLREYIISEAMHALGIPTTRALAAIATGDDVVRETKLPGAVLTRVASSHIRVGTFQYFFARDDIEALRALADYTIDRHYPEAKKAENPIAAMLSGIVEAQAELIVQWMMVGFIHGVMNTDNMSIAGQTIDYGPCAFMDIFDPKTVFSAIDQGGRYAYAAQPSIGQWNLSVLAQALLPTLDDDETVAITHAKTALDLYPSAFQNAYEKGFRAKLGLEKVVDGDVALWQDLTKHLTINKIDYTRFFRALSKLGSEETEADHTLTALFGAGSQFDMWLLAWLTRLQAEDRSEKARQKAMQAVNPAYIPRNHLVEEALAEAHNGNMALVEKLMAALAQPYTERAGFERYLLPPEPDEVVQNTFCGT